MARTVALIGFGAIAQEAFNALEGDETIHIKQVLVRDRRLAETQAAFGSSVGVISRIEDLSPEIDFVLECAGHEAVREIGPKVLSRGHDFGVISVGALANDQTLGKLRNACTDGQSRLSILAGAIGGIDAVAAAGDALEHITYVSRKPPLSWSGSPAEKTHDLRAITEETEIFAGNARAAAIDFPKNANVVATVALAGIGFERTKVSLIADPEATGNTHQITARGPLFDFSFQTSGSALPANPKTSALTALSAVRALRARAPGISV